MRRIGGRILALATVLAVLAVLPRAAAAGEREERNPAICKAVPNLLIAIQSDNQGLRESAAYYLGEFKCERAVLPLMHMLRHDPRASTRIVAALALSRIGDSRGTYAVRRAALYDDSEKVRNLCAWYYNEYVQAGSFAFGESSADEVILATKADR